MTKTTTTTWFLRSIRGTLRFGPALLLLGCGGGGPDAIEADGVPADCAGGETYPPGQVDPMTLGETLAPYAWPEALHLGTGQRTALDLSRVPCATDPEIDWSPHDVLLFVSIPAW